MLAVSLAAPAAAQQRPPSPEQRIERLERQLRQVQGRVFQRGQPADTAGFDYEPAAPLSAVTSVADVRAPPISARSWSPISERSSPTADA